MRDNSSTDAPKEPNPGAQLALGLVFGIVFGFLLQKGGVAKYHILIGVLLLEDFTVIKVMLSAIIVGMVGIFAMHRLGMVELHLKPTRYAANVLGGLVFGVGFALIGYCPGNWGRGARPGQLRRHRRRTWPDGRFLSYTRRLRPHFHARLRNGATAGS